MQDYFNTLVDAVSACLRSQESYTCTFRAEDSDFVRFNRSAVRQAGTVRQRFLNLDLVKGRRHAGAGITLTGDSEQDRARLIRLTEELRQQLPFLPEDPHLLYATEVRCSAATGRNDLPESSEAVEAILQAGRGFDLVGMYAAGGIFVGFANSFGQRNWFANYNFNFDWSLCLAGDKAVKAAYAGLNWERNALEGKMVEAAEQLEALKEPPRDVPPGNYRVYLAPAAVADLLGVLAWGGFGLKAHRTKKSSLLKMAESGQRLHPHVTLRGKHPTGRRAELRWRGFHETRSGDPDRRRRSGRLPGFTAFGQRIWCSHQRCRERRDPRIHRYGRRPYGDAGRAGGTRHGYLR